MTDICLVQPPIRDFYLTVKRTFPAGLASIAASLRAAGFAVKIIDALASRKRRVKPLPSELADLEILYGPPDRSPFALFSTWAHHGAGFETIARRVAGNRPFLVGVSALFTAYADEALATAEAIRRHLPDACIVVGGHHATALPDAVMACPAVDFAIRGEGEEAMVALARALTGRQVLETVPGLVRREKTGGATLLPTAPAVVDDLDRLPPPALDLVPCDAYRRAGRGAVQISASRGCPFHCTYCAFGAPSAPAYRRRSVESVLREIDLAASREPIGFIDFEDENLTLNRAWTMDLMAAIRRRFPADTVELRAMNGLMPSTLDDELLAQMKAAGFAALNLSLGTAVPARARVFQRPDFRRAFDRVLAAAVRLQMSAVGYIIVAAPGQTAAESLSDLLFLARRPVLAGLSVFYPVPGTIDFQRCLQMKALPATASRMRATTLPVQWGTSRLQTVTLLRLGRLLNFIKALMNHGQSLPDPAPLAAGILPEQEDRLWTGRQLLAAFLYDGVLRGIDKHGHTWPHPVDADLTRRFRRALRHITVRPSGHRASL